ncbi:MAG: hypothetical protein ACOC58_02875 [Chloroflexota bacterium]
MKQDTPGEDVRELQASRDQALGGGHFAGGVIDTVREPLLVLDADLRVTSANLMERHGETMWLLNLPEVHGMEVLRQVKQDSELQSIPVVVLTASKAEQDIVEIVQFARELLYYQACGP